jgi:hypothetical protein
MPDEKSSASTKLFWWIGVVTVLFVIAGIVSAIQPK